MGCIICFPTSAPSAVHPTMQPSVFLFLCPSLSLIAHLSSYQFILVHQNLPGSLLSLHIFTFLSFCHWQRRLDAIIRSLAIIWWNSWSPSNEFEGVTGDTHSMIQIWSLYYVQSKLIHAPLLAYRATVSDWNHLQVNR